VFYVFLLPCTPQRIGGHASGFCEDSFRHMVMECFHGALETKYVLTKEMKEDSVQ
jgi:hypothetical protein